MTLREIGVAIGGVAYTAVAMTIKRLELKASRERTLRGKMKKRARQCEM